MDKVSFKKKIVLLSIFLLIPDLNVRPYSKNFILVPPISESLLSRIEKISRSHITINLMDNWVNDSLAALLKGRKSLKYNIVVSGEIDGLRVDNLKQLSFTKMEYVVDRFVNRKFLSGLERLKPALVSLTFKRLPERFEVEELRESRIREITLILDSYATKEFISRLEDFSDFRTNVKVTDTVGFSNICSEVIEGKILHIIYDSRIMGTGEENLEILSKCRHRMIYEIPNKTYYNNFLQFIKSGIENLNIYYDQKPARDDIIYWILKTDP